MAHRRGAPVSDPGRRVGQVRAPSGSSRLPIPLVRRRRDASARARSGAASNRVTVDSPGHSGTLGPLTRIHAREGGTMSVKECAFLAVATLVLVGAAAC